MAWTRPEYNRSIVNKAGDTIIENYPNPDELDEALEIVGNWRAIHGCPLQSLKMTLSGRAKRIDPTALISQRTKRVQAIILKLRENHAHGMEMKLTQMQDIGGCRAVLQSVDKVHKLQHVYKEATSKNAMRGGVFQKENDYIRNPKETGYRGVHLVFKYHSDSPKLCCYNDLKIEIQIRSRLQHAWATAVESVDFYTGQSLKSNIGDLSWKRFFALASSEFARIEKCALIPGTPFDPADSKKELRAYSKQITLLKGLTAAHRQIENKEGHFFLLELDLEKRILRTTGFSRDQLKEANDKYLEVEKKLKERPELQAVLVSVDSLAALPKAYPSYYLDIREFVKVLSKVIEVPKA